MKEFNTFPTSLISLGFWGKATVYTGTFSNHLQWPL